MNNIRIWWFGEFVILWSHSYGKHICIYFLDFIDHILVLGIFYDKCLMEIHFENLSINKCSYDHWSHCYGKPICENILISNNHEFENFENKFSIYGSEV